MKKIILKRVISLLIAIIMTIGLAYGGNFVIQKASAADEIEIYTWADLNAVRNGLSKSYILMNDLTTDMPGYDTASGGFDANGWKPIGLDTLTNFKGTFNGNGNTIHGLWTSRNVLYLGLFAFVSGGRIENLNIVLDSRGMRIPITGGYIGGLVGGSNSSSVISNCTITGGNVYAKDNYAGGFAGVIYGRSNITNCTVTNVNVSVGSQYTGGFAGTIFEDATASGCSVIGGSVAGVNYVGGAFGAVYNNAVVEKSFSEATVTATGNVLGGAGGFVGTHYDTAIIKNCYARGKVHAGINSGGFLGFRYPIGPGAPIIENCYATGAVTCDTSVKVGGFFGSSGDASTTYKINLVGNNYFDTQSTGLTAAYGSPANMTATSIAPQGKSTAQMMMASTFTGWQIGQGGIWSIDPSQKINNGYPYLKDFYTPKSIFVEIPPGNYSVKVPLFEIPLNYLQLNIYVKDSHGTIIPPELLVGDNAVSWTINPPYPGAAIDDSGMLGVTSIAPEGILQVTVAIGDISENVNVAILKDVSVPKFVVTSDPVSMIIPSAGEPKTHQYTTVVQDQYGIVMPSESVIWRLAEPVTGVSITPAGLVSINSTASAGNVTLRASVASNEAIHKEFHFAISYDALVPAYITLTPNIATVEVPTSGVSKLPMSAVVNDQYGGVIYGETVAWSIPNTTGISIDTQTGELVVTRNASSGVLVITATLTSDSSINGTAPIVIATPALDNINNAKNETEMETAISKNHVIELGVSKSEYTVYEELGTKYKQDVIESLLAVVPYESYPDFVDQFNAAVGLAKQQEMADTAAAKNSVLDEINQNSVSGNDEGLRIVIEDSTKAGLIGLDTGPGSMYYELTEDGKKSVAEELVKDKNEYELQEFIDAFNDVVQKVSDSETAAMNAIEFDYYADKAGVIGIIGRVTVDMAKYPNLLSEYALVCNVDGVEYFLSPERSNNAANTGKYVFATIVPPNATEVSKANFSFVKIYGALSPNNIIQYGDFNDDKSVNSRDLSVISAYISGSDLTLYQILLAADVNGDATINSRDMSMLAAYLSNETPFTILAI